MHETLRREGKGNKKERKVEGRIKEREERREMKEKGRGRVENVSFPSGQNITIFVSKY